MADSKPKRRESRPRLDAIMRHIKAGSFDGDLNSIVGAVQDRRMKLQEAVLAQVHEVFGPEYVVTPPQPPNQGHREPVQAPQPNVFIDKATKSPRSRPGSSPPSENELPERQPDVDIVDTGGGAVIGGVDGAFGPGSIE
jgi:hypothetical protein